jgi:hypothetical protein
MHLVALLLGGFILFLFKRKRGKEGEKEDKININCSKINMIEERITTKEQKKSSEDKKRGDTIIKSKQKI